MYYQSVVISFRSHPSLVHRYWYVAAWE